jgi:hypothetical protein
VIPDHFGRGNTAEHITAFIPRIFPFLLTFSHLFPCVVEQGVTQKDSPFCYPPTIGVTTYGQDADYQID